MNELEIRDILCGIADLSSEEKELINEAILDILAGIEMEPKERNIHIPSGLISLFITAKGQELTHE